MPCMEMGEWVTTLTRKVMKRRMKKSAAQLHQFEQFYRSFCSSEEVSSAVKEGTLSTDWRYTKSIRWQRKQQEERQKEEIEKKEKEEKRLGVSPKKTSTSSVKENDQNNTSLTSHKNHNPNDNKELVVEKELPWPFKDLLRMQNYDGRWLAVGEVFRCLNLPEDRYFQQGDLPGPEPSSWEQATALAIAKMRQRYDLFEQLGHAHDRAMAWIKSPNLLRLASEVVFFLEKNGFGQEKKASDSERNQSTQSLKPPVDPYVQMMESSSVTNYSRVKRQEEMKNEKLAATEGIAQKQVNDERRLLADTCLQRKNNINYEKILKKLQELHQDCTSFENKCIELVTFVDKLRWDLKRCLERCVDKYKSCKLQAERNVAFEELQASLADDVPARVGYSGWQAVGKHGYRKAIIDLLNALHNLATARLTLREVCQTVIQMSPVVISSNAAAKDLFLSAKNICVQLPPASSPADMFYMSWNGQDMMKYIYKSLDFLHGSPLLLKWFGTAYPWFGNPIAFCVPFEKLCQSIVTDAKVEAYLDRCERNAKQVCRYLMTSQCPKAVSMSLINPTEDAEVARRDDRVLRDDILNCQDTLDEVMQGMPTWWPKGIDLSDLNYISTLYTAFLALRVTTREYAKTNRHSLRDDGDFSQSASAVEIVQNNDKSGGDPSHGHSTKRVPEDFKSWLFHDDWYDDYHARQSQSCARSGQKLRKLKSRSYHVPSRPGSCSATANQEKSLVRKKSRKKKPSRSSSEPHLQDPQEVKTEEALQEEVVHHTSSDAADRVVRVVSDDENSYISARAGRPPDGAERVYRTKEGSKQRRRDVEERDIGGDLFSAMNDDKDADIKNNDDEDNDDDVGHGVDNSDDENSDDGGVKGEGGGSGGDSRRKSSDVMNPTEELLQSRTQDERDRLDHLQQPEHVDPSSSEAPLQQSEEPVKRPLELPVEQTEETEDGSTPLQEHQEDHQAARDTPLEEADDDDDASIESLSEAVKNSNLLNASSPPRQKRSSVSAQNILEFEEPKLAPKQTAKKTLKAARPPRSTPKKSDARRATSSKSPAPTPVDTDGTPEPKRTEKERKNRRKATVSQRLEAARRGTRRLAGPEDSSDGALPELPKKNTVSRISSKPSGQNLTRRANSNALVMPPVSHSKSQTSGPASRRQNI